MSADEVITAVQAGKTALETARNHFADAKSRADELANTLAGAGVQDRAAQAVEASGKLGESNQATGGVDDLADEAITILQTVKGDLPTGHPQTGGWQDSPLLAQHRLDLTRLGTITPARRIYILDGDGKNGGGHRSGLRISGKTEFPPDWDEDQIMTAIRSVATDPDGAPRKQNNGRWRCEGTRDGVALRVILTGDGAVHTAHPLSGPGVVTNP